MNWPEWVSPDGRVRLINADCLDVRDSLPPVDAIVTDPPYGLLEHNMRRAASMMSVEWDANPADVSWLVSMNIPSIIWGGNYFPLPPTRCVLVWDKKNDGRDFADLEQAWTNLDSVARIFRNRPMNLDGGKRHPTQKPVDLMRWCLGQLPDECETILDPFAGSCSTAVACIRMERRCICIEREPRHYQTGIERCQEEYQRTALFDHAEARS
jgi:DNA modification methylase